MAMTQIVVNFNLLGTRFLGTYSIEYFVPFTILTNEEHFFKIFSSTTWTVPQDSNTQPNTRKLSSQKG